MWNEISLHMNRRRSNKDQEVNFVNNAEKGAESGPIRGFDLYEEGDVIGGPRKNRKRAAGKGGEEEPQSEKDKLVNNFMRNNMRLEDSAVILKNFQQYQKR